MSRSTFPYFLDRDTIENFLMGLPTNYYPEQNAIGPDGMSVSLVSEGGALRVLATKAPVLFYDTGNSLVLNCAAGPLPMFHRVANYALGLLGIPEEDHIKRHVAPYHEDNQIAEVEYACGGRIVSPFDNFVLCGPMVIYAYRANQTHRYP